MFVVEFPELSLDATRFINLDSLELHCAVRTWAPEASFGSCSSVMAFVELFTEAPAIRDVEIGVSVVWRVPEGVTPPHMETLNEEPERATSDFALELLYDMPWWRVEALTGYASLERVVVCIFKSRNDWYAPEDYTVPITNHMPWPPRSQEVEVCINWELSVPGITMNLRIFSALIENFCTILMKHFNSADIIYILCNI